MSKTKLTKPSVLEAYLLKRKSFTRSEYSKLRLGFEQGVSWAIGVLAKAKERQWESIGSVIEAERLARSAGAKAGPYFAARLEAAKELWEACEQHNLAVAVGKNGDRHLLPKRMRNLY